MLLKMKPLLVLTSLLASVAKARPDDSANATTEPFVTQLDNETWVIGNDVWNMTQQRTYGVKLMYNGRDCVGEAVGHYVSYSMSETLNRHRGGTLTYATQMAQYRI
jgi:rhamnogalacturonan endolyase